MRIWLTILLARAGPALVDDRLPHHLKARSERLHDVALAADHDRESRLAGADVPPRDGRVDRMDAALPRRVRDLDCERGLARRHVDEHRSGASPREDTVPTEDDVAYVVGKPDHREHDVARRGDLSRRRLPGRSAREQGLRLRARAVEHRECVAGVAEMAGHARPHHPEADPADSRLAGGRSRRCHAGTHSPRGTEGARRRCGARGSPLDLPIRPDAQPDIRPFGPPFGPGARGAVPVVVDVVLPENCIAWKILQHLGARSRSTG
jgi:hypothetical protein